MMHGIDHLHRQIDKLTVLVGLLWSGTVVVVGELGLARELNGKLHKMLVDDSQSGTKMLEYLHSLPMGAQTKSTAFDT
jgi:hypothetical protein